MRSFLCAALVVGLAACGVDSVGDSDGGANASTTPSGADAEEGNTGDASPVPDVEPGDAGTGANDAGLDAGDDDSDDTGPCKDHESRPCYTGPKGTRGVARCVGGMTTCEDGVFGACVGEITPEPETCDGVDNDCDGTADNGNPGGGETCATGLLGVCSAGITACENAILVCNQSKVSSVESCDTLDNDCDGTPDDGVCLTGGALDFDGIDDRVNIPVPNLFNNLALNDFTMEAWVYPTSSVFARIVFAQASTLNFASLTRGADGESFFYVVANGFNVSLNRVEAVNVLPLNQWTHVAGTYTAATGASAIYINGVAQTVISGGNSTKGTDGAMEIGSRTDGQQFFQGKIDEVKIWSVARPGCEIAAAFACEGASNQPGLVASYRFDQGTLGGSNLAETQLLDGTPAANHGLLFGFGLSGTTSNWVAAGGGVGNGLTGVLCGPSGC